MKIICAFLAVGAALDVHPDRISMIKEIQATPGVLWKAVAQERFATRAPGASKSLCGAIGDQSETLKDLIRQGEFHEVLSDENAAVPDSFDSAENWPQCAKIINDIRDQSDCGCCWAFAGAEAGSDRMCISTNASIMIPLSAQDVCFNGGALMSHGCMGGRIASPWLYMKKSHNHGPLGGKGAVSGGQYKGTGPFGKGMCSDWPFPHCHHHGPQGTDPYPAEKSPGCPVQTTPAKGPTSCGGDATAPHNDFASDKYMYTGKAITARGESAIQQAILAGGPMEVAFDVYADFENYQSGIYHHVTGDKLGGHAVKVVGWGVDGGNKYWKIANSWNPYWGESGFFRISRGSNECEMEAAATASSPDSKWTRGSGDSAPVVV